MEENRKHVSDTENTSKRQKTNKKGGPKRDEVWEYFIVGDEKNDGHYPATCYHCKKTWQRGKPGTLKAHLSNECLQCPEDISKFWRDKLSTELTNYTRKQKTTIQPPLKQYQITQHFGSDKPLPLAITERIDRSLLKAWVMAGIPFEVIDNPFIRDLFQELNPRYTPPSRTTLSGRLLDQEVARVSLNIEKELIFSDHLTLTLDGWTSKKNDSLYNYIISTPARKEYLIALRNYSAESHTGLMLANEISDIIEQVGSEKFAAIVTDAASACRVAREKTEEMYPHIWDIRCAAHAINLIAADLVKLDEIQKFIADCGKITKFFHKSHQACSILRQGLAQMMIKSEGLHTWIKTRWGSLFMTTDSILRARSVFDWIILEHQDIISNIEVRNLLENEEFFTTCRHIRSIWAPIKECINILESNTATLADCFIHMIKLAIAIYRLPNLNPFKIPAIHIFNIRYLEFQHPAYLFCYFIHPQYRGRELRNRGFRDAALIATKLWQSLGHDKQESYELISHLRRFEAHLAPYDLPYIENMDTSELCLVVNGIFDT